MGHEWVSLAVTFVTASVFWVAQHRIFDLLEEISTESLILTFMTLGFVAVLPFTTSMWGHHISEPLAFLLYFTNQFGIALPLASKLELALRRGQVRHTIESALTRLRLWLLCGVIANRDDRDHSVAHPVSGLCLDCSGRCGANTTSPAKAKMGANPGARHSNLTSKLGYIHGTAWTRQTIDFLHTPYSLSRRFSDREHSQGHRKA